MNVLRTTGQLLLDLHRLAGESSPGAFQAKALALVAGLIPFAAAAWPTGVLTDGEITPHTIHLLGLAGTFVETWTRHKHEDHLIHRVMSHPGVTFNVCVREEFAGTAIRENHCKPNRIEQILCTSELDPTTGLSNVLALYRQDEDARFSEQERQLMEVVVPHLFEAWKTVRIQGLRNHLAVDETRSGCAAIADRMGMLHVADHRFVAALRSEWPDWNGARLPEPILALNDTPHALHRGEHVAIRVQRTDDQLFINVRPRSVIDTLSKREMEIARHFALGLSHKEIAGKLAISPATVRTHIATIYLKARINSKIELAGLLNS